MPYSSTVSAYGDNVISQYVAVLVFSGQKNFTLKQLSLIVSSTDGPYLVVVVVQGRGGGRGGSGRNFPSHTTSHPTRLESSPTSL